MKTLTPQSPWFIRLIPIALLSVSTAMAGISTIAASDGPPDQAVARIQFSAGVSEILKMVDAKVEGSVILAYIESSPTAYNPSASEIIMLKDRDVPAEVIAGMLKHGSEMRNRAMASAPPPPQPSADMSAPYAQNPGYSYTPPADYSDYGYPSSSVYYSYNYAYPYYGYPYYSYSYPWYGYWPSFYSSYYPYYHRYPFYNHRYPFHSFGHFDGRNHFNAFRGTTHFNGGFNRFPMHNGGFRAAGNFRAPVTIGSHGGMRGGTFGGGVRAGGGFRSGGGFTSHGGGGGHMGGRAR
jgi:uncharacterized membrane protein YgcG